jgi:hypothetical protein
MQKAFTLICTRCDGDDLRVLSFVINDTAVMLVASCADCDNKLAKVFSFAELYRRGGAA